MSLHLVSYTELRVRVCVVDASDERAAKLAAARLPAGAWREVHYAVPDIGIQALDGVPLEDDPS